MINIWYKYKESNPEIIDSVSKKDLNYTLGEYKFAFKGDINIKVWAGRKKDEPK